MAPSTSKAEVEQPTKANPSKKEVSEKLEKKTNSNTKAAKSSKARKDDAAASKKASSESKSKEPEPTHSTDESEFKGFDNEDEVEDDADASEIDDQTEALLKGFESDRDDEDPEEDKDLEAGQEVPELSKKQRKKFKKDMEKAGARSDKPGVVYIGRIPHGFYEHEMREYFKQFGNILKLRLSRNVKTGASKHYAFLQFESATVADIVAKTMDNYLLFGHLLKVKVVPDERVPADLFKGANKRFKKVPWNAMEGRKLKQGATEAVWDKRVEAEEKKRGKKAEKLKAIGYEFDAPKLKTAKGVAKQVEVPALTEKEDTEVKAIEAAPVPDDSSKPKKKKKKSKTVETEIEVVETVNAPVSKVVEKEQVVIKTKVEGGDASEVKIKRQKKKSKKEKAT